MGITEKLTRVVENAEQRTDRKQMIEALIQHTAIRLMREPFITNYHTIIREAFESMEAL